MVRAWHWCRMASVNQTRPHCVNQMGKTHSKPLTTRHGRGTAWARHAMNQPLNSHRSRYVTFISKCDCTSCVHNSSWHAHSYDVTIFKVDIPLCDNRTSMYIITVNTTKVWCLLQQHVLTHVGHHRLRFLHVLTWQWPTWVETCCCDKHQNLIVLTVIINIHV